MLYERIPDSRICFAASAFHPRPTGRPLSAVVACPRWAALHGNFLYSILPRRTPKNAFTRGIFLFRAGHKIFSRRVVGSLQATLRELAMIFIPLS